MPLSFFQKRYVGEKLRWIQINQNKLVWEFKRRDNAPIVKYVYGGVIDIIMNEKYSKVLTVSKRQPCKTT